MNRFVPLQLLDGLQSDSSHDQAAGKGMAGAMPTEIPDLCLQQHRAGHAAEDRFTRDGNRFRRLQKRARRLADQSVALERAAPTGTMAGSLAARTGLRRLSSAGSHWYCGTISLTLERMRSGAAVAHSACSA